MPAKCGAITQKGTNCRRKVLRQGDSCYAHRRGLVKSGRKKPTVRSNFQRAGRVARGIGSALGGVAGLIEIIDFVEKNWPHFKHFFRYMFPTGMSASLDQIKERLKTGRVHPGAFVYSFKYWYGELPSYVRIETESRFTNMQELIRTAKNY